MESLDFTLDPKYVKGVSMLIDQYGGKVTNCLGHKPRESCPRGTVTEHAFLQRYTYYLTLTKNHMNLGVLLFFLNHIKARWFMSAVTNQTKCN